MPRKVIVVGARGFLGEHIVAQLVAQGHEVLAVVRSSAAAVWQSPLGQSPSVRVLQGDVADVAWMRSVLDRGDAAVFCAGRTWQPGLRVDQYRQQNVAITEAFFDAVGHRPQMRIVFTSSLSTVGGSKAPQVYAEDSGRDGIWEDRLSPYDRAKIDCEQIALQSARRGNDVIVLNPGLLLGPGASPSSNLAAPFALLWFLQRQFAAKFFVNGGVTLSDVRDVAAGHVAALDRGDAGKRYILGGHNLDRATFYARVTPLVGRPMPTAIPWWVLYSLVSFSDALALLSGGLVASPVHRSFAFTQRLYYYGASDRAVAELGYCMRPIEQTIFDTMLYYQSRDLLPPDLAIGPETTLQSAASVVLLRQLVGRSGYGRAHRKRLPELYRACQANHALRDCLDHLMSISTFDARRGRFSFDARAAKADLQTLQKFFEYVYFSSDEFLRKVL